jgi:hypothetical protein
MGFVPTCAPHRIGSGYVSDSPIDLMYQGRWTVVDEHQRDDPADRHDDARSRSREAGGGQL